jgi:hypothetical protein
MHRTFSSLSRVVRRTSLSRGGPHVFKIVARPLTTDRRYTITDAITKDHRTLYALYDQVVSPASSNDTRERYGNQFTWELARHAVGEELVLYPAVERYVDGGKELADREREDTQKVRFDAGSFVPFRHPTSNGSVFNSGLPSP